MYKKILATVFLSITCLMFFGWLAGNASAVSYADGTLLKSNKHTSVYYIEGNKRRAFVNRDVYGTWFDDFSNLQTVTVEEMESIELGNPMPIKAYTKLLKFPLNPRVYRVVENEEIRHIPDEDTAKAWYGLEWAKEVIELPEIYFLFYAKGEALEKQEYIPEKFEQGLLPDSVETEKETGDDCPGEMLLYKNETDGYSFCYNENGEVKLDQYGTVTFSRLKGGEDGSFDGSVSIVSGYDDFYGYIGQLDGNVIAGGASYNGYDVSSLRYDQAAGGWSGSSAIFQNQVNKKIFVLTYGFSDGDDKFFLDGLWNTFQFLDSAANGVDPWEANTTMSTCPSNANMKFFKREYNTDSYEYCYNSNWSLSLGNLAHISILPPAILDKDIQKGWLSVTSDYNAYETTKNDNSGDIVGLVEFTTDEGDLGLAYYHTDPSGDWYYAIGLYGDSRRATFSFQSLTGKAVLESYASDFTTLKNDLVDTWKFL